MRYKAYIIFDFERAGARAPADPGLLLGIIREYFARFSVNDYCPNGSDDNGILLLNGSN